MDLRASSSAAPKMADSASRVPFIVPAIVYSCIILCLESFQAVRKSYSSPPRLVPMILLLFIHNSTCPTSQCHVQTVTTTGSK